LEVATDPEHRFDLALSLGELEIALEIARTADVEHRWKTVGDAALTAWNVPLADECFSHAKDLGSLLLLYTATANAEGLQRLAKQAEEAALHNVAFSSLWQLADVDGCIDLLLRTNRKSEAVMFAQTYKPSRAVDVVAQWKESLEKEGKSKISKIIGVPPDEDMFPEWDEYLRVEKEGGTVESKSVTAIGADEEAAAEDEAADEEDVDEVEEAEEE